MPRMRAAKENVWAIKRKLAAGQIAPLKTRKNIRYIDHNSVWWATELNDIPQANDAALHKTKLPIAAATASASVLSIFKRYSAVLSRNIKTKKSTRKSDRNNSILNGWFTGIAGCGRRNSIPTTAIASSPGINKPVPARILSAWLCFALDS